MGTPQLCRDYIIDYLNSDASKYEGIYLSRDELKEIANYLEELQEAKDYIEPLRNTNTHNEHLDNLKEILK